MSWPLVIWIDTFFLYAVYEYNFGIIQHTVALTLHYAQYTLREYVSREHAFDTTLLLPLSLLFNENISSPLSDGRMI